MATIRRGQLSDTSDIQTRIVRNPRILSGEPTVRGTRVPVRSVVINYRRTGTVDEVCTALALAPEDVEEALQFYEAHQAEIDALIEENERATYG